VVEAEAEQFGSLFEEEEQSVELLDAVSFLDLELSAFSLLGVEPEPLEDLLV
jgi:hypothetical protein